MGFEHFNSDLDYQIYKHFKSTYTGIRNQPQLNHSLIGKKYIDNITNEIYTIKSISKQWYQGWYLLSVADDDDGSSRAQSILNISCHDKLTLDFISDFNVNCKFLK